MVVFRILAVNNCLDYECNVIQVKHGTGDNLIYGRRMEDSMKIAALDHGYVRLVDSMGSDLTSVNSARVSYDKEVNEVGPRDKGLIRFLGDHGHESPFRNQVLQFEVHAPLMIARQWWKYVVSSNHRDEQLGWNESSRRYITEEPVFYEPIWREAPENSKQGSGECLSPADDLTWTNRFREHITRSMELYEHAMEDGICAEQARCFLPAYAMYVRWYWTCSLQSVAHLLNQRVPEDAQKEWQPYCHAIYDLTKSKFDLSLNALLTDESRSRLNL